MIEDYSITRSLHLNLLPGTPIKIFVIFDGLDCSQEYLLLFLIFDVIASQMPKNVVCSPSGVPNIQIKEVALCIAYRKIFWITNK